MLSYTVIVKTNNSKILNLNWVKDNSNSNLGAKSEPLYNHLKTQKNKTHFSMLLWYIFHTFVTELITLNCTQQFLCLSPRLNCMCLVVKDIVNAHY